MLTEINLKNYAIIESLKLNFKKGLNVITGETGTGKSIIVDAINIILGDKSTNDLIRTGADEAVIEAVFDLEGRDDIKDMLTARGISVSGNELLIRRIIPRNGRGRIYINDNASTLKLLVNIAEDLIDIFSQHEHQSLLRERNHIKYLDLFMGKDDLKEEYRKTYEELKTARKKLDNMNSDARDLEEKQEFLKYQLNELISLNPQPDEDTELEQECSILSNSEEIAETINEANRLIYERDESIYVSLNRILKRINNISHMDKNLSDIGNALNETIISLEDIAGSIRSYSESISHDPGRLDQISNRLAELNKMKKKYKTDTHGLISKIDEIQQQIDEFQNLDQNMEKMQKLCDELSEKAGKLAAELRSHREIASRKLSQRFSEEAPIVGLKDSTLEVSMEEKDMGPDGSDKVRFLFSANPGEIPRDLSKVASGGELSRVMLLLKELLTKPEHSSVLIFDEADSGIGGAVAEAIGKKIKTLSANNQVLCITHLPQVAKFADYHYVVTKYSEDTRTKVSVEILDENSRIKEIGRMLAGETVTDKTLEAAKEMLSNS